MLKILKNILQANEFLRLPKEIRSIVFYSEGKNYWPLFKGLINGILDQSDLYVCYITSGKDDPGFEYSDIHFKSFLTDDASSKFANNGSWEKDFGNLQSLLYIFEVDLVHKSL